MIALIYFQETRLTQFNFLVLGCIMLLLNWSKSFVRHCVKVSVFGVILVCIFAHSAWMRNESDWIRMRENTDQNNSEYRHLLGSEKNTSLVLSIKKCLPYSCNYIPTRLKTYSFTKSDDRLRKFLSKRLLQTLVCQGCL